MLPPFQKHRRTALKNLSLLATSVSFPFIPLAHGFAKSNRKVNGSGAAVWDIVQIVDTSTLQQDVSKDFLIGSRAAWQSINQKGGLHGQPVRHVVLEVDGTEASARKAFIAAQSSGSCLAISGTTGDSTSQFITQWLQDEASQLAHVAPWLQNSERVVGHKTFAICADRQTQISHAAAYWASVQIFIGGTPELIALVQGLEIQKRSCVIMGLSDINLQTIQQLNIAKQTTIIVAQSVPVVTSPLPIVQAYRAAMTRFFDEPPTPLRKVWITPFALSLSKGWYNEIKDFDKLSPNGIGLCRESLSLTGFISARYTYEVLSRVSRPLSRLAAFNAFAHREPIDLGGYKINYRGTGRGSQYVTQSMLGQEGKTIG